MGQRSHRGQWIRSTTRYALYLRDGWTCAWCGAQGGQHGDAFLTMDHVVGVAELAANAPVGAAPPPVGAVAAQRVISARLAGVNHPCNLVTACWRCNIQRSGLDVEGWLSVLGLAGEDVGAARERLDAFTGRDLAPWRPVARKLLREAPEWLRVYQDRARNMGAGEYGGVGGQRTREDRWWAGLIDGWRAPF